jgi:hypothetical protein
MPPEKAQRKKRLGHAQLECMRLLSKGRESWTDGGFNGWIWDSNHGTKKILDTLVKSGLVDCQNKTYSLNQTGRDHLTAIDSK